MRIKGKPTLSDFLTRTVTQKDCMGVTFQLILDPLNRRASGLDTIGTFFPFCVVLAFDFVSVFLSTTSSPSSRPGRGSSHRFVRCLHWKIWWRWSRRESSQIRIQVSFCATLSSMLLAHVQYFIKDIILHCAALHFFLLNEGLYATSCADIINALTKTIINRYTKLSEDSKRGCRIVNSIPGFFWTYVWSL